MIHHHSIGDAKVTGVIEYSGPTHDPAFLYPAVDKTERDAVLRQNASWLAPNHYAPGIDRLIVYPLVGTFSAIPISVNGLGLREGGYVFLLAVIGIGTEKSIAFGILLFLVVALDSLLGGLLFLMQKGPKPAAVSVKETSQIR